MPIFFYTKMFYYLFLRETVPLHTSDMGGKSQG